MTSTGNPRAPVPEGWHSVTPRIVVEDAKRLVEFIERVFDAAVDFARDRPSIVWIGDSPVMVSEAGARRSVPGFLYVYVSDTDAAYRRAVEAGARAVEIPFDTPYGDRRCMVEDEWGNIWQIATLGNPAPGAA